MLTNNPLLQPFDEAPFSKIKPEHYKPAFLQAIADTRKEIDAIVAHPQPPTFENTLEALEFSGELLHRISSIFFNLNAAATCAKIQAIAQEISPLLSQFNNDITLNTALFQRVKAVYDQKEQLALTAEQHTLLEKHYKHFCRNGVALTEADKEQLRAIDAQLAQLSLAFGENVLAETNQYELLLTDEEEVKGLPDSVKEAAAQRAAAKGKAGWLITLEYPSYIPFMKYAENRGLRKTLFLAFGGKGFHGNALDNQQHVLHLAALRHKRANLLGYPTHAHFVLEERMAKTPEKVLDFMNELLAKAKPAAEKEFAELEAFAKGLDGIEGVAPWDGAYYTEKLKQKRFALDDETLKPYFALNAVVKGVFKVAEKLFGLTFREVFHLETYHEHVQTFEVYDRDNQLVSLFYTDVHPRAGKRSGAWMTSYKPQYMHNGTNHRPHIAIVCNLTRATETTPSLLTFREVTTLFHEFGHALHGMLANTTYPSLSGTSVYWDFVELPSQLLENWCYEKEALELFAFHYKTGELIPMELVEQLKASATFQEGMATLRQLGLGFLDMAWHGTNPTVVSDVKAHEVEALSRTALFPNTPETCTSTQFSHIFQGGYASGYYSYKWAEVLDADAFTYFKEHGVFNSAVAAQLKTHILSKGGTEDPMTLYQRFRGATPKVEALLERAGLLEKTS